MDLAMSLGDAALMLLLLVIGGGFGYAIGTHRANDDCEARIRRRAMRGD